MSQKNILLIATALLFTLCGCENQQCPTQKVEKVDHALFDNILRPCVNTAGLVDYDKLQQEYVGQLREYLDRLAQIDVEQLARGRQKLAFWINAYNALCLQQVLDLKPLRSAYLEDKLFFERRDYFIAGRRRTLNEIQNQIIRPAFSEPRALAALCAASLSAPPLRPEAYRPETLAAQLDHQCRIWINSSRHNRLDRENKQLYLSAIFKNFAQDFDRLYDNPRGFFLKYTTNSTEKTFLQTNEVTLLYLPYDWSLNTLAKFRHSERSEESQPYKHQ